MNIVTSAAFLICEQQLSKLIDHFIEFIVLPFVLPMACVFRLGCMPAWKVFHLLGLQVCRGKNSILISHPVLCIRAFMHTGSLEIIFFTHTIP